jgi:hypothetical protein
MELLLGTILPIFVGCVATAIVTGYLEYRRGFRAGALTILEQYKAPRDPRKEQLLKEKINGTAPLQPDA